MAMDYKTQKQFNDQLEKLTAHPSGPTIHQGACPEGYILDSEGQFGRKGRCISLVQYRKMQQQSVGPQGI